MSAAVHFQSSLAAADQANWQLRLDQTRLGHPSQTYDWGSFLAELGYRIHFFFLAERDDWPLQALCASRPIPFTRQFAFDLGRGPVSQDPALLKAHLPVLLAALRQHRAAVIRIRPLWSGAAAAALGSWLQSTGWQPRYDESQHTLEIDLTQALPAILQTFKSAVRYEIRRAEKVGVTVRPALTDEEFTAWFALYVRMCAAKGIGLPNAAFHRAQWDRWLKVGRQGVLLLAFHQNRLLAGSVVMRDAQRATYFYGASIERIAGVPMGEPLQWHAIQWARQHGCQVYDLGGYHPAAPAGSAQYNVDRFKLGFSERIVEYLPAHELVLAPAAYQVLKAGKRIVPKLRAAAHRLRGGDPA